jgi:hypothetical protein
MFEKPGSYLFKIKCAPNTEQVGVLARAKNGDQVFWEEKFHAANGKAQACTQGALLFSLSCLGEREREREREFFVIFPGFPMCSQYVPFKFPMGSHDVPQFCNVFHNMCSIAPHFIPICLGKMVSSYHLYRWAKGEELYT